MLPKAGERRCDRVSTTLRALRPTARRGHETVGRKVDATFCVYIEINR